MFNIPDPRSVGNGLIEGFNAGSNHKSRMLQHMMQQRQLAQQKEHFLQNFGLKQAEEQRNAALHPHQMQNLIAQAQYHQAQAQDLANQQNLIQQYMGQFGQQEQPQEVPNSPMNMQNNVPSYYDQGQEQQNAMPPSPEQVKNGFGKKKVNPMVAAAIKKRFGFDPNALTEEEKSQRRMSEFEAKEQYKAAQKKNSDLTELTPTTRTRYQEVIREIDSVMPTMDELINQGGQKITMFGTAKDTSYLRKVHQIADVYMKAKGWPNTNEARKDAIHLFQRKTSENASEYKAEMQRLKADLKHEYNTAKNALSSGKVGSLGHTMSQEEATNASKNYETKSPSKIIRYNAKTGKYE